MRRSTITMIAVFLITLFPFINSPAFAQTVVVPNSLDNVEGGDRALAPFNCGAIPSPTPSIRYQEVYLGSQFPEAGLIDKISLRLNNELGVGTPGFGPTVLPNVLIKLSTTQAQPNALSLTFADNIGADVQTVFSDNLSLSAPDCNAQPCPFDVMILLQKPFFYNPEDGNLLFDVRIPDCINLGPAVDIFFDATDNFPTIISRVSAPDVNANVATRSIRPPLVTQFRITEPPPSATDIPTISEWGLIITAGILGIIGLMVIRRMRLRA